MTRIAVIGAGLSGLVFAHSLGDVAQIRIFEKSRGFGGRMATRRFDDFQFDHGAQFFTAKSGDFQHFLQPWIDAGVVARWDARFVEFDGGEISGRWNWDEAYPHFVAVPGMSALGRALAESLDVVCATRVAGLAREADGWSLTDDSGESLGRYDWVVSAIPAAQALVLLPPEFEYLDRVAASEMPGCYSLMLGFDKPLPLDWDAALVKDSVISWISVNRSKPGRDGGYTLLIHASNRWAEANMALADEAVVAALREAAGRTIGEDLKTADRVALHRWRYANPGPQTGDTALVDVGNRLAAIGDWCIRGRVEAAFQSGRDAARRITSLL